MFRQVFGPLPELAPIKEPCCLVAGSVVSDCAGRAKDLGWIGQDEKLGCITKPGSFRHLEVPDGELLSERIVDLKTEQERLLKAQAGAIAALDNLVIQIAACKRAAFVRTAQPTCMMLRRSMCCSMACHWTSRV